MSSDTFPYQVCLVTGAGSGIGRALAVELSRRGCKLALCDVDEDGLSETERLVGEERVFSRRVDVAERRAVHDFVDAAIAHHGRVDAVFNNAGVSVAQTLVDTTYEDFEWLMGINFWGVLYGTKAVLPHMLERGTGAIINISSVFGLIGFPCQSAYNASKFAVRGMTEALRHELRDTDILVSSVHPGGVRTNIVKRARFYRDVDGSTDHAQSVDDFEKVARLAPEQAADQILRGVRRGAPRILVGTDARWIDRTQRLMPTAYGRLIGPILERMQR